MKKAIKNTALYIVAIIISLTAIAQDYRSFPMDKINFNSTGVYYTLPKTEIIFKVKVEKIQENKGVYADYAYLIGAKNIIINDAVRYRIKDIDITTRPVGDSENIYFLDVKKDIKINKTKEGALLSIGEDMQAMKTPCHKGHKQPKQSKQEAYTKDSIFFLLMPTSTNLVKQ